MSYEDTIDRLWKRDEKTLTRQLLRDVDQDATHFIRFDRSRITALKADDTKRAAVVAQVVDLWTIDEGRIYTGQEPLDDAELGATIISHAKPQPVAAPVSDEEGAPAVADSEKARRSSRPATKARTLSHAATRLIFDLQSKAAEGAWLPAVQKQLARDRSRILAIVDEVLEDSKRAKAIDDLIRRDFVRKLLAEIDAWSALARGDWDAIVDPLIRSTGRSALRSLAADVGVAFDLLIPGLSGYTEQHAAHLVTQITATTREAIASTLSTGLANGENMDKLRDRVKDSDAAFGTARAELIARTESTGVTNGAQFESMRAYADSSGERVTKEWLDTDDKRTRDSHDAQGGEVRELHEPFTNGLQYPGDPTGDAKEVCNCRCTAVYAIQEAAA